jgi:adenylyltransferase/sulfurtransferase
MTREELIRYSRQLVLPEIGEKGQAKLQSSSVLIVGAGGLGSPAAYYLAAAGIGRIGIFDSDSVDLTNLHRQILHTTAEIGKSKVDSACKKLSALNPLVHLRKHRTRLDTSNALKIMNEYDLVIDGSDNLPTRYLINDACVLLKNPYIYGSIYRFEGQVSIFSTRNGPCYRCLFPEPPPPEMVPSCESSGVLGALTGIIGSFQAMEAIKFLLGIGNPLIGRLLLFDGLTMQNQRMKISRNPECKICGDKPLINKLIDYEDFCSSRKTINDPSFEISPEELKSKLDSGEKIRIIDIRTSSEHRINCIEKSELISDYLIPARAKNWDKNNQIVIYCKTGSRSAAIVKILLNDGFENVKNLIGGIDSWIEKIDPSLDRY